jgi:hypothetical protein
MLRLALAALAASIALPCFADETGPPAPGSTAMLPNPVLVCDTQAQIASVVDAAKAQPDGGAKAKYDEFKSTMDAKGEPTCIIEHVIGAPVSESTDMGTFQFMPDHWFHGWAVHIGDESANGWMLYLEPASGPASFDGPMLLPHGLRLL